MRQYLMSSSGGALVERCSSVLIDRATCLALKSIFRGASWIR
jgi:hypothetical protein